jgi:hypothetical protein
VKRACVLVVACICLLGAGCGDDDATTSTSSPAATSTATSTTTTGATDGVFTPRRDAMEQVEAILSPPPIVTDARELAQKVADAIAPEGEGAEGASVRIAGVEQGEPSLALIEVRGLADDSVAGYDLQLTLEPDDSLGWAVVAATRRDLCSRGVSGTLCS